MATTTALQAAVKEHGSVSAAARALKINRTTLRRRLAGTVGRVKADKPVEVVTSSKPAGRSLADFRAQHDKAFYIPQRIQEALRQMRDEDGNPGWAYEAIFSRTSGVSLVDLGNFRDQFSAHIIVVSRDGRRAWAATPALAEKMRGMVR